MTDHTEKKYLQERRKNLAEYSQILHDPKSSAYDRYLAFMGAGSSAGFTFNQPLLPDREKFHPALKDADTFKAGLIQHVREMAQEVGTEFRGFADSKKPVSWDLFHKLLGLGHGLDPLLADFKVDEPTIKELAKPFGVDNFNGLTSCLEELGYMAPSSRGFTPMQYKETPSPTFNQMSGTGVQPAPAPTEAPKPAVRRAPQPGM